MTGSDIEIWSAAVVSQPSDGKILVHLFSGPTEAEALGRALNDVEAGVPVIAKVALMCATVAGEEP